MPRFLRRYTVKRQYRGAVYEITVENPQGVEKGVRSIQLNGENVEGDVLPVQSQGSRVSVLVRMG